MFISISKNGNRYSFTVGDSPTDNPGAFFDSSEDFDLVQNVKSDYPSYAEAHAAGLKLVADIPSAVMAKKAVFDEGVGVESAEERVVGHFSSQIDLIGKRMADMEGVPDDEKEDLCKRLLAEIKAIKENIKGVLEMVDDSGNTEDLEDMLSSLSEMKDKAEVYAPEEKPVEEMPAETVPQDPLQPQPDLQPPPPAMVAGAVDTLLSFGVEAAKSLVPTHRTAHVRLVERDDDSDSYFVHIADEGGDVCSLKFTGGMLLTGVCPSNRVAAVHPYHSVSFMERYWEPVVMAMGHYLIPGKNILVSHLHEDSTRRRLASGDGRFVTVRCEDGSWWLDENSSLGIRTASSERPSLVGKEVRCVKKSLPTYYGRTGMVAEEIPRADRTDVVVDFRRGLGTLVLTAEDIEQLQP